MGNDDDRCTLALRREELETLHALVTAKLEGVLVHSEQYFALQDLAHKLADARARKGWT